MSLTLQHLCLGTVQLGLPYGIANRTGQPAPVSAKEVSKEIEDRVELVVDGGRCKYCQPSTLLDLENRKIIRPGAGLDKALKAIK